MRLPLIFFLLAATITILFPSLLLYFHGVDAFARLSIGQWGTYLSGIFGPATLLILGASFLTQRTELRNQIEEVKQTRTTLDQQKIQLERTASENETQNKLLRVQAMATVWSFLNSNIVTMPTDLKRNISSFQLIEDDMMGLTQNDFGRAIAEISSIPGDKII
jgi:hypothetical protein